jgi:hypothetical protein
MIAIDQRAQVEMLRRVLPVLENVFPSQRERIFEISLID